MEKITKRLKEREKDIEMSKFSLSQSIEAAAAGAIAGHLKLPTCIISEPGGECFPLSCSSSIYKCNFFACCSIFFSLSASLFLLPKSTFNGMRCIVRASGEK